MKQIKIFHFILVSLVIGCSDMLETQPTTFFSQESYWNDPESAINALTGCYYVLGRQIFYGSYEFHFENLTPNAFYNGSAEAITELAEGRATATTLGLNNVMWKNCYNGIGRCNTLLQNIDKVNIDDNLKLRISGEAKFIRAFLYNRLNVLFNGVPLILNQPNIVTDSKLPRDPHDKVLSQVLVDLNDAIHVLPVEYSSSEGGRITKGAALAMKARVLLQENNYQEVVNTIESIFKLNKYELFPDYNGIFRKTNEGNAEVIFDIRYKGPDYTNGDYNIIMAQFNTQAPVQGLVDAYEMIDGLSINDSPLYNPNSPYENRDPRFEQTILYLGVPWRNRLATDLDLHQTGYGFRKFTEYNGTTEGTIPPSQSDGNYVVIRFADVLLMYAEALNELLGPTPEVYSSINQIRQRPSVEMPPLPSNLDKNEMREAIRHERRVELAGESSYFYDIRRWRTIDTLMNQPVYNYKGNLIQNRKFDPKRDYFWPIPFTEIDLNPNLEQNPGY